MGRKRSGQHASDTAAIDRADEPVSAAVERYPNLAAAPLRTARCGDPHLVGAVGQRAGRLEDDRWVRAARRDQPVVQRRAPRLARVRDRSRDPDRLDGWKRHYGVSPGISSASTVSSPVSFSSMLVTLTGAPARPSTASVMSTMSIGSNRQYFQPSWNLKVLRMYWRRCSSSCAAVTAAACWQTAW